MNGTRAAISPTAAGDVAAGPTASLSQQAAGRPTSSIDAAGLSPNGLAPRELRHEVGNALTAALAYAQFLARRLPVWADEPDRRALRAIVEGITRAAHLLAYPPPGAPVRLALCDLVALVGAATHQVPPERWADVSVRRLTDGPLLGPWEEEQVTQVLTNLLANAAKYSPAGTPVEVEVGRLGTSGWARVVVRDRGIGINEAVLEDIFFGYRTPLARGTAAGSGLGLRLSRRLAEAQGGLLWAMNRPEGGSAFYLELPLAEPEGPSADELVSRHVALAPATGAPAAGAREAEAPVPRATPANGEARSHHGAGERPRRRGRSTLLLVEDDVWTRSVMADLLEHAGYAVVQTSNGHTGLRLAAQLQPAALVLDLTLPERSGVDLLRELRRQPGTREIPVVVVSAGTTSLDPADAAQADGLVQKPFADDELLAQVQRSVAAGHPGAPLYPAD